jgi:K+-sensing histidine kinase KdpD
MTSISISIEAQSARDVISCLATFAHNIAEQQSFNQRLKDEVDQRTSQLSHSLQVKSYFLSSCSHELRSPLSAVLVSPQSGYADARVLRRCSRAPVG